MARYRTLTRPGACHCRVRKKLRYQQFITGQYFFNWRLPSTLEKIDDDVAIMVYRFNGRNLLATNGMGLRRHENGYGCEFILEYANNENDALTAMRLIVGYQIRANFVATDGESIDGSDWVTERYVGKHHILFIRPDASICAHDEFVYEDGWNIVINQVALISEDDLREHQVHGYKSMINQENINGYTQFA
jgi:uncharacterized protein YggL (DUF469 family)